MEIERTAQIARQGQLTEVQARKIIGDIYQRAQGESLSFTDTKSFLLEWVQSKTMTKAQGTSLRYRKTVEDFIVFLDKKATQPLSAITPRHIEGFRDLQVEQGKSSTTANMAVKTLRIPFNTARRQGLILSNPAEAVDLLSASHNTRDTFTREQIGALFSVADIEWRGMILFGACHGLRIGDAAKLTWENIDAERQSLRLRPQKTRHTNKGRGEEYPLHPDIIDYLSGLSVNSKTAKASLFPSLSAKKTGGVGGLSLAFRRLMAQAGIYAEEESVPKAPGKGRRFFSLGFHSFRHTAISEQANQGVSQEIRMKLSGHKSKVHERYTHHELEAMRKEIQKVPSFLTSFQIKEK
ncbi:MAG: tyrosine-type recombinase/integrase [Verrucomicrobium sp.]|nr:tyrosine-type recombinase/integrase [Verrucomicrobium sp.]